MKIVGLKSVNLVLKTIFVAMIVFYIITIPLKGVVDIAVENGVSLTHVQEKLEGIAELGNLNLAEVGKKGVKSLVLGINEIITAPLSASEKSAGGYMWGIMGEAFGLGSDLESVLDGLLGL